MPRPNSIEEPSDETLLASSLASDPEAFGLLVKRYERRIYGLLWRSCSDGGEIDDLYQQVWIKAWAARAGFQGRSKFGTWIYAIALNQVREWRRRKRNDVPLELVAEPPSPAPSALDRLLGRSRQEGVNRHLKKLSDGDRDVITLRYQEGLEYDAIATLLKTTPAQIRLRSFRALQRLREHMKDLDL
jgi:RNA polymerase sigma-70 factor (ECF subfamily)